MLIGLKEQLQETIESALKGFFPNLESFPSIDLEVPQDRSHGEFATNMALKSAKIFKKSPMEIGNEFCQSIQLAIQSGNLKNKIDRVAVEKPGFINFYLSKSALWDILIQILEEGDRYGRSDFGKGLKLQIEFVSANPTGPLSVAHGRQAAVGDALVNILNFIGFDAKKEYYVNDEGNQIHLLGKSIQCRALGILGEETPIPENGYQGEYIRDIAQQFLTERKINTAEQVKKTEISDFCRYGVDELMSIIKKELVDFGVEFDCWTYQSQVASVDKIEKILAFLREKGFVYEKEGALWFKTTLFGDDQDRVVKKSDGNYTYFTPDIVYHQDKFARGFKMLFNVLGPDHHGYIPRLKAAVEALGQPREALEVLIIQLATLYRDGQPIPMSTRLGQYISLHEVMDEVGVDAARFLFLMRHIQAHLDFDLNLAKKETPENPVYYVQYAHARIHSIVSKAKETGLFAKTTNLALLNQEEELNLLQRLGEFPEALVKCYKERDPFALVTYLIELATGFHKFYDRHRVVDVENNSLSSERLSLIEAVRIVLANGLHLLGVSTPKQM